MDAFFLAAPDRLELTTLRLTADLLKSTILKEIFKFGITINAEKEPYIVLFQVGYDKGKI